MKRYLVLLAVMLAVGSALAFVPRKPRAHRAAVEEAAVRHVSIELRIAEDRLDASLRSVPLGHVVTLHVRNASGRTIDLTLAGYEDRVAVTKLAPRDSIRLEFTVDRPGEDFAWLLDGQPAGRLRVEGSHMVEGHR